MKETNGGGAWPEWRLIKGFDYEGFFIKNQQIAYEGVVKWADNKAYNTGEEFFSISATSLDVNIVVAKVLGLTDGQINAAIITGEEKGFDRRREYLEKIQPGLDS